MKDSVNTRFLDLQKVAETMTKADNPVKLSGTWSQEFCGCV